MKGDFNMILETDRLILRSYRESDLERHLRIRLPEPQKVRLGI